MSKELLGEELYNQVKEKLGDKEFIINDGSYLPRAKFNEVNEAKKVLETEIKNRDTQLTELSSKVKGNEELTKQLEELRTSNDKAKFDYETKVKDITLNTAIEKALMKENSKFPDLLVPKFDRSKLVIDGDKVIGLDEQLAVLKSSYKELFGENIIIGNQPNNPGGTQKTEMQQLEESYNEAVKVNNTALAIALKNKIFILANKK